MAIIMLSCYDLTCEYLTNPIGIDTEYPRFSWKLRSDASGVMQTAYELTIGDVWCSGWVESSESVLVEYGGAPLTPFTRYPWRVRIRDNHGETAAAEGFFETGTLGSAWHAQWITTEEGNTEECPVFRRTFRVETPVKSARLYITAHGVYEAELNGSRVGDCYLTPGWTAYHDRILYQTYDITGQIATENAITVTLGKGWCRGRLVWENSRNLYEREPDLIAMLRIETEDGSVIFIGTDTQWQYQTGPILMSEIYDGEIYDARKELTGASKFNYIADGWKYTKLQNAPNAKLIGQINEPIRHCETVHPISLITTPNGETVIDFGQNMVGWAAFTVSGKSGERVVFDHAEVLDRDGNFYSRNMRTAKNRIEYTLRGDEQESYHPHFTFEGFRYIRILEFPGTVKLENFTGMVLHSDMKRTGDFRCSNDLLNQLFQNVIWGQRGNFLDVPTDCPQRDERLGWSGDAQVFIRTAALNYNVGAFFTKWLGDVALEQSNEYGVPNVIPNVLGAQSSSAWGDVATIAPWEIYRAYGDRRILETQYESMKNWVEYIRAQGENELLWNTGHHFGDWLSMDSRRNIADTCRGGTAKEFIATAFYAHSASLVAKAANILGKTDDAAYYEDLHKRITEAFQHEFISPNGRLSEDTQTAHVLALYFNLSSHRVRNAKRLAELVEENGCKLTTGFVGTPYLCHVLSENGYSDLAYSLLMQTEYPSWLYSVTKGATTIWEHWDGIKPDGTFWSDGMNSYNHYAYGAIADWMYSRAAGIQYNEDTPGYRKITIAPLLNNRLEYVSASVETMYGRVESTWERKDDTVQYIVVIPPNTQAEFIFPDGTKEQLGSGSYQFEK